MGVFKKGRCWYIEYYITGQRRRKKIGPSKQVAELALKDVELTLARGEYLGIYEDTKITLNQVAEDYLAYARANRALMSVRRDLQQRTGSTQAYIHQGDRMGLCETEPGQACQAAQGTSWAVKISDPAGVDDVA